MSSLHHECCAILDLTTLNIAELRHGMLDENECAHGSCKDADLGGSTHKEDVEGPILLVIGSLSSQS